MVIPVDVFFDKGEHLAAVALLLMLGVEGLDLYTPEEALRCFDEHPVGELRVGTGPGRVRDDLAVVTVDRRGEVHLPIPGLDLGDVRESFLVRHLSREIAVGEVAGSRRGLALV